MILVPYLTVFFQNLNMPTICEESKNILENPVTAEELNMAIQTLQSGKSPGTDGFPSEFYKKFSTHLIPHMLNMYNESLESGVLPQSLKEASISLILKKNKNPSHCKSYRPISLLNVDVKILAKVLALRLERFLPQIISPDQTGFIKN